MKESKTFGIIYTSRNTITGKYYVGATTESLEKRKEDHVNKSNNDSGLPFHQAIATYGVDAFEWQETDTANSVNELAEKEKTYILEFNTTEDGYNKDSGGGFKKTVYQYKIIDGSIVGSYNCLKEAGKVVNSTKQQISRACLNVNNLHKGFYWSYNYTECFKPKKDVRKKKVLYYNFVDDIIQEFHSVSEASKITGISKSNIARYCRGIRKPSEDVFWEYL